MAPGGAASETRARDGGGRLGSGVVNLPLGQDKSVRPHAPNSRGSATVFHTQCDVIHTLKRTRSSLGMSDSVSSASSSLSRAAFLRPRRGALFLAEARALAGLLLRDRLDAVFCCRARKRRAVLRTEARAGAGGAVMLCTRRPWWLSASSWQRR